MLQTMCMGNKRDDETTNDQRATPTVRAKRELVALVQRISKETGEPAADVLERLLPLGRVEQELQRVLREKREAIDKELKGLDKKK